MGRGRAQRRERGHLRPASGRWRCADRAWSFRWTPAEHLEHAPWHARPRGESRLREPVGMLRSGPAVVVHLHDRSLAERLAICWTRGNSARVAGASRPHAGDGARTSPCAPLPFWVQPAPERRSCLRVRWSCTGGSFGSTRGSGQPASAAAGRMRASKRARPSRDWVGPSVSRSGGLGHAWRTPDEIPSTCTPATELTKSPRLGQVCTVI